MKLSELKASREVLDQDLKDPEFRRLWEQTALARAVANRLISYRAEHDLTQTALAEMLGMKQPQVARLELGEKNPTWETLARLAEALAIEFLVDIAPAGKASVTRGQERAAEHVERVENDSNTIVVAVR